MMNKIRTYDDLLARQQQLEVLLRLQKQQLRYDVNEVFEAGKSAVVGQSQNWLLNKGVNTAIDVVVKKGLLGNAGWLYRLLVPLVLKKYSKSYIAEHTKDIKNKFFSFFRGKSNGVNTHPDNKTKHL